MDVIILAAGQSKRLKKLTEHKPKCLIEVIGRTILERQLTAIDGTEASKCIIVAGFRSDKILEFVRENRVKFQFKIEVVDNPLFATTDNAYSLTLGLERSNGPIIILDGDIIFESALLIDLYHNNSENVLLCDDSRVPEDDDCKIQDTDGYAVRIGKRVPGQWVYTSMIKLGGFFLSEFTKEIRRDRLTKEWYSEPLDRVLMENKKSVKILFTRNNYRTEIDTEEDLSKAEQEVSTRGF